MIPTLFFYAFLLVALVWLFLMLYWLWPHNPDARFQALPTPPPPRRERSREPKPFVGLSHKPPSAQFRHPWALDEAIRQASTLAPINW
jgi:hypothetical protein